jgi:hypothetical protein
MSDNVKEDIEFVKRLARISEKAISKIGLKNVEKLGDDYFVIYLRNEEKFSGSFKCVLKDLQDYTLKSSFEMYHRTRKSFNIQSEPSNITHYAVFRLHIIKSTLLELTLRGIITFWYMLGPLNSKRKDTINFISIIQLICDQLLLLFEVQSLKMLSHGYFRVITAAGCKMKETPETIEKVLLESSYIVAFQLYNGIKPRMRIIGEPGLLNQQLFMFFMKKHSNFEHLIRDSIAKRIYPGHNSEVGSVSPSPSGSGSCKLNENED